MTNLLIISHALVSEPNQARWRFLAEAGSFNIRLLVPKKWISRWFKTKKPQVLRPNAIQRENFEVCPVPTTNDRNWGTYLIKNLHTHLCEFTPDVIYCIHEESVRALHQTIIYRRLFARRAKLIYFTMNVFPRVGKVVHFPKGIRRWFYRKALWLSLDVMALILSKSRSAPTKTTWKPSEESQSAISANPSLVHCL